MKQLIILIFVSNLIFAQIGAINNNNQKFLPRFDIDLINSISPEAGKTKVDIYFQFPYSSLQFVKSGNDFVANYTVTIDAVYLDSDDIIVTDVYDETLTTESYDASISNKSSKISIRSLHLNPGKYEFMVSLLDNESSKEYSTSIKKEVLNSDNDLFISDLLLIRNSLNIGGKEQLVPNISKRILSDQRDISFYYNIHSKTERKVNVTYKLIDIDENKLFEIDEVQSLTPGNNAVIKTLTQLNLGLGKYILQVYETGKAEESEIRTKVINSIIKGFPASIKNLDEAISQMKYIATPTELDVFDEDSLSYSQKMKRFIAFWKSKDTDPSTEYNELLNEYYRRIEFANRKFKSYSEGWRTDMGYVYVLFGSPDSIDRNPFNAGSKPYEVWYYNSMNRRFVFVDNTGFGEYRLINHDFRDLTDFRY